MGGFSLGRRRCAFTFLISTLAALQRGICVSFMCGFSAGYDAVTIATLSPVPLPPHPPVPLAVLPILVVASPLFRAQCKEVSIVFCSNVCHASSQFTVHSRLHKQVGVVNPIKQLWRVESRGVHPHPLGWVDNPPSGRQFKLIINASANIVVIIHAPVAPPVG